MVMERAKDCVRMGIEAARELLPLARHGGGYSDSHLWILSHGFLNGFNSVVETLVKVEMNSGDALLSQAIKEWIDETAEERKARLGRSRNLMTHQGKALTTERTVEWETDGWNDTIYPVFGHTFAKIVRDGEAYDVTFEEWALNQFVWLDRGLREIEVAYNRLKRAEARTVKSST